VSERNPNEMISELIDKSTACVHSDTEKSICFAQEALQVSETSDNQIGIAISLLNIGLGNYYKSNYSETLRCYTKSLKLLRKSDFYGGLSLLLNNLGALQRKIYNYEKALEYYFEAIEIDLKINQKSNLVLTYSNVANIYIETGNKPAALEYNNKALNLAEEIGSLYGMGAAYSNIGNVHLSNEDYTSALECYEKSKDLCVQAQKHDILISVYSSISKICLKNKDFEEAASLLKKAKVLAKRMQSKGKELQVNIRIAVLDIALKDYDKAENLLLNLISDAEQIEEKSEEQLIYFELYQLYEKTQKFELALQYLVKYHAVKSEIDEKKNSDKLQYLQTRFEVETKERELELIKQKNAELEEKVAAGIANWKEQHQLLIQKSKLESLGRLAAGIAHEINQPLQGISLGLENIRTKIQLGKLSDEYMNKKTHNFSENVFRIKKLIEHIRIFSREQTSMDIDIFDVNEMIRKALSVLSIQFKKHNIALKIDLYSSELLSFGNKYRLEQVMFNLLSNARDAVESDSNNNEKKVSISSIPTAKKVIIKVRDNGIGITAENLENIFNPFFTTKEPEKGTGLGLSIAYGIIQEMKGEIRIKSAVGIFTEITITLPLAGDINE
jgi:two-component system, NtrC family, sensor kinase